MNDMTQLRRITKNADCLEEVSDIMFFLYQKLKEEWNWSQWVYKLYCKGYDGGLVFTNLSSEKSEYLKEENISSFKNFMLKNKDASYDFEHLLCNIIISQILSEQKDINTEYLKFPEEILDGLFNISVSIEYKIDSMSLRMFLNDLDTDFYM